MIVARILLRVTIASGNGASDGYVWKRNYTNITCSSGGHRRVSSRLVGCFLCIYECPGHSDQSRHRWKLQRQQVICLTNHNGCRKIVAFYNVFKHASVCSFRGLYPAPPKQPGTVSANGGCKGQYRNPYSRPEPTGYKSQNFHAASHDENLETLTPGCLLKLIGVQP